MKRFYCTVCKKIRRARSLPVIIDTPKATNPTERVGQCNSHTGSNVIQFRKGVK